MPALATDGDWLEAPFWIWSAGDPLRRRLFVRAVDAEIEISDRAQFQSRLPLSADSQGERAVEKLAKLAQAGIKIRPRALITTMFARLLLGDLFLHGIGGAKYDELTDAIIAQFFGLAPPAYYTLSATMLLPIERPQVAAEDLRAVAARLRELRFNPQRFLDHRAVAGAEALRLVADKQRWIETNQTAGRERHRAISEINGQLQRFVNGERQRQTERYHEMAAQLRVERILGGRDFSFCLFPEKTLCLLLLELSGAKP